ncbi:murein hydrolase activator EnvC family protein [Niabella soli]|uniref:M23ase beta-sheet core domain-containing protein n=1 Tax=Niabella soli DSM 19437 TaxID=929713 RepID=W0F8A4_9BACT|nr:M23 family metallopeptidase [Niabella soli]AHF17669.1 hypothetical protein NIASO_12005 [Niabella soli DSM 19437]
MTKTKNGLLAILLVLTGNVFAQNDAKITLKKDRAMMINEMNQIERTFKTTKKISREAMMELTDLNRKIEGQERYVTSMSRQEPPVFTTEEMQDATREITRIKRTVETLRNYYYHPESIPKDKNTAAARPAAPAPAYTPPARTYPVLPPQQHATFPVSNAALTGDFGLYRGQIPYPLEKGTVIQGFGRFKIEGSGPEIMGDNPGCTFSAPVNSAVKAVFEGDVISISKMGSTFYIVVRHGRYFTAYSNLASSTVTKGSRVKAGQVIGTVGRDDETGYGKLDFILMFDDKNLDPQAWFVH